MEKEESDKLLNILFKHQERLDLSFRFRWTPNTIAIWDNRSVLHYAIADYFPQRGLGYKRIMDRIAVRGKIPNLKNTTNLYYLKNLRLPFSF